MGKSYLSINRAEDSFPIKNRRARDVFMPPFSENEASVTVKTSCHLGFTSKFTPRLISMLG